MTVNYLTIRQDFLGKDQAEIQTIISGLENSERKLLLDIFNKNFIPITLKKEREALNSLHEKLIYEETGCCPFAWLANLFKGPWFESLRVYFGKLESSSDLASLVHANLATTLAFDVRSRKKLIQTELDTLESGKPKAQQLREKYKALTEYEIRLIGSERPGFFGGFARDQIAYEGLLRTRKDLPSKCLGEVSLGFQKNQSEVLEIQKAVQQLFLPPVQSRPGLQAMNLSE